MPRFSAEQTSKLEQELFKQRTRLADAERTLLTKTAKAATESKRIASDKIDWIRGKLEDLSRTDLRDRDSRIFPGQYAPVMVVENGQLVVKPMRYQCRPAGKPAFYDTRYPGTDNARREKLEGFWKGSFGYTHGLMLVSAYYENVPRHRMEGRELAEGSQFSGCAEAPCSRTRAFDDLECIGLRNVCVQLRPLPKKRRIVSQEQGCSAHALSFGPFEPISNTRRSSSSLAHELIRFANEARCGLRTGQCRTMRQAEPYVWIPHPSFLHEEEDALIASVGLSKNRSVQGGSAPIAQLRVHARLCLEQKRTA